VNPCLSLSTYTPVETITFFEILEVSIKTFEKECPFFFCHRQHHLEPLYLDCAALQFLTSCFVFDAVGIFVKLQSYIVITFLTFLYLRATTHSMLFAAAFHLSGLCDLDLYEQN
jgi:hypothetical protein